jgi:hypothetical protein
MDINCSLDTTITTGQQPLTCSIPYLEPISYNGETSYIQNYWTSGELIISILLFIFLMFEVFKYAFEVFFPKIVELKKWRK